MIATVASIAGGRQRLFSLRFCPADPHRRSFGFDPEPALGCRNCLAEAQL
jgi:hypothetical protein